MKCFYILTCILFFNCGSRALGQSCVPITPIVIKRFDFDVRPGGASGSRVEPQELSDTGPNGGYDGLPVFPRLFANNLTSSYQGQGYESSYCIMPAGATAAAWDAWGTHIFPNGAVVGTGATGSEMALAVRLPNPNSNNPAPPPVVVWETNVTLQSGAKYDVRFAMRDLLSWYFQSNPNAVNAVSAGSPRARLLDASGNQVALWDPGYPNSSIAYTGRYRVQLVMSMPNVTACAGGPVGNNFTSRCICTGSGSLDTFWCLFTLDNIEIVESQCLPFPSTASTPTPLCGSMPATISAVFNSSNPTTPLPAGYYFQLYRRSNGIDVPQASSSMGVSSFSYIVNCPQPIDRKSVV